MNQPSIKRNFLYNATFQVLLMIVPLFTAPYISRVLGPENIGIQSYTNSIVSYFSLFAVFGLNMYGQREIAYCVGNKRKKSTVFWEVFINKFLMTVIMIFCYMMFIFHYDQYREVFLWQTINLVACIFDISWYFQGIQDFKKTVIRNAIVKIIGTASIFTFIHSSDDLILYIFILSSTTLLGNMTLWFYMPNELMSVPINEIHPFRDKKIKLELFAPYIAIQIYTVLDKTMIGYITNDLAQNGYYEQSQKIIQLSLGVLTSLGTVLIPNIAERFAKKDFEGIHSVVMKAYHFILVCACPMTCGLSAIAPVFVPWFFGPGYEEVIPLLQIFSLLFIIITMSNIAGAGLLTPMNRQNYGTLATIGGAITNFSLNLIMIRNYGAMGAAVASVIAETVVTTLHFIFIRNYINLSQIIKWFFKYAIPSVLMGGIVYIVGVEFVDRGIPKMMVTVIQIIVGILIYTCFITFIYHEFDIIKKVVKR